MSGLSDDVLARLRSLDLVGFAASAADTAPEIARSGIAKSGVRKLGISKAGVAKVGLPKLGIAHTR